MTVLMQVKRKSFSISDRVHSVGKKIYLNRLNFSKQTKKENVKDFTQHYQGPSPKQLVTCILEGE